MGVDLNLLPAYHRTMLQDDGFKSSFSHTILPVDLSRSLHDVIKKIEEEFGKTVPEDFYTYLSPREDGETQYGPTPKTRYGKPMMWVFAGKLRHIADRYIVESDLNRATWAYIRALPEDWPVALHWC